MPYLDSAIEIAIFVVVLYGFHVKNTDKIQLIREDQSEMKVKLDALWERFLGNGRAH